jgi:hypothetical protein
MAAKARAAERGTPRRSGAPPAALLLLASCAALLPAGATGLKATGAAPGAAPPDAERYLWFPLHSGGTNQLLGIKAALMLGAILNRTVVLPPLPVHKDISYNHCRSAPKDRHVTDDMADGSWECQEKLLNHSLSLSAEYFQKGRRFRAVSSAYDVGSFEVPTKDMFDFYYDTCRGKLSVHLGCGQHRSRLPVVVAGKGISDTFKWRSVADVRNTWGVSPFREAPVLAVGSTFRMRALRFKLRLDDTASPRLKEVLVRLMRSPVPFSSPVAAAAEHVSGFLKGHHGSYSAFHLRFPDSAENAISVETVRVHAQWASRRLRAASVPVNSSIYIASNLREGCGHRGFKQLCSVYNCFCLVGGTSGGSRGGRVVYNNLMCKAGLCDSDSGRRALQDLTGMPEGDLMAVIDKQVCVLADQGFWPTSGSCYSCSDEQCPQLISPTYANDIIKRRSESCMPSCTGGPAGGAAPLPPGCLAKR